MELSQSAVVDLQESPAFSEPFYVVVLEKEDDCKLNESFDQCFQQASSSDGNELNDHHLNNKLYIYYYILCNNIFV